MQHITVIMVEQNGVTRLLANLDLELGIQYVVLIAYQDYGRVEDCPQTHYKDCGATNLIKFHLQDLMNLAKANSTALPNKVIFWVEEINHADHVKKAVVFINDLCDLHALMKEYHDSLTLCSKGLSII